MYLYTGTESVLTSTFHCYECIHQSSWPCFKRHTLKFQSWHCQWHFQYSLSVFYASYIVCLHAFSTSPFPQILGDVRSGDLGGHNPLKYSITVLVVWHAAPSGWINLFHEVPVKSRTAWLCVDMPQHGLLLSCPPPNIWAIQFRDVSIQQQLTFVDRPTWRYVL
jgi:hypothetical protein